MATTSPEAALAAVAAIEETGVRFAILHDEATLAAEGVTSDVDMVVDRSAHEVVRAVAPAWARRGLYPVMVWPYDVGGTGSIFLSTSNAGEGAQLDVLHDPEGRGRYGAMSDLLLDRIEPGRRFPTTRPAEQTAYLLAKRLSKGQIDEARRLTQDAPTTGIGSDVLRPDVAEDVAAFISDGSRRGQRRRIPSLSRTLIRLRRPVGAWIEIRAENGETLAREMARRFGRFLPHVRDIPAPNLVTWATGVAPIRWRAGVVASHGDRTRVTPAPDLTIRGPISADDACTIAVRSLTGRFPL